MAISDGPAKGKGKAPLLILFSVFLLIGTVLPYFLFVRPALKVLASRDWPSVECRILSSRVGSHSGSKGGTTYSVDITFEYEREGARRRSDDYDFMGGSSSGYEGKAEIVKRYPAGSTSLCWVNPSDPSEAVLCRDFRPVMLVGLFPLIFAALGAGGLTVTLRKARPPPARPAPPRFLEGDEEEQAETGPVVLQPETSKGCRLAGAVGVCLFWNGIVSMFVWRFVDGWQRGRTDGALGVFLIPFVGIGLFLVGMVFYTLLSLANPVPRIRAGSRSIPLGGMLDLEWEFTGATHRLRALRLTLEGREEATYRRGKHSTTDKHVFARIAVYEGGLEGDFRNGKAIVPIPRDTMPSFASGNNQISWTLVLQGEIGWWPDVKEEFPFTILPAEGAGA